MKTIITAVFSFLCFALYAQEKPREFEMTEGDTTYIMKQYVMCFLKKGPNRNQDKEEAEQIQKAHLAHMDKLAHEGKIAIAGPFGGEGDIRGIVIYDVASIEEAKSLTAMDPAVKAGRLAIELHEWWAAKGSKLP